MNNNTNQQWIKALNNNNVQVFEDIYDSYSSAIYANIFKLLPKKEDAEDILQSVFLQLWESRQTLTEAQNIPGWLYTTSFYKTMEHLRSTIKIRLQQLTEHTLQLAETDATSTQEINYIKKVNLLGVAVNQLPPRKKKAFVLCKIEGKTYSEAAIILGISEDTVREYVKTAISLLKRHLFKSDPSVYMLIILLSC